MYIISAIIFYTIGWLVGNANIVEKIVHVEDKEKMKELEEKLEKEKKEIRRKADEEQKHIEKQANL
jgi:hypothetical protein